MTNQISNPVHYKNIYGYFDFEGFYIGLFNHLVHAQNPVCVEVGTWLGKSTCFMAELIQFAPHIKFYGVDTFLGEINAKDQQDIVKQEGGSVYKAFLRNMANAGVLNHVTPLQLTSKDAATLFADNSLDAVFLDAEHLYDDVMEDLKTWFPKVKPDGIIAGHDYYDGTQVKTAVDNFFEKPVRVYNTCFYTTK